MAADDKKISEFNEAGLQIQRLHNAWCDCRRNREAGNLLKVKWILDSIEVELNVDIIRGEHLDKIKEINKTLSEVKDMNEFYSATMDKEKLLREVQDSSGKGGKYKDPDEDSY